MVRPEGTKEWGNYFYFEEDDIKIDRGELLLPENIIGKLLVISHMKMTLTTSQKTIFLMREVGGSRSSTTDLIDLSRTFNPMAPGFSAQSNGALLNRPTYSR